MKVFGDVLMRVWMVLGVLGQLASAAVGLIYWERDSFATGLQYWLICGLLIAGVTILGGGAILFVFGLRDDDGRPFWGRSTK